MTDVEKEDAGKIRGIVIFWHDNMLKYRVYGYKDQDTDVCEATHVVDSFVNTFESNAEKERVWTIRLIDEKIRVHLENTRLVDYAFSNDQCEDSWAGDYTRIKFWSADKVSVAYRLSPG
eukprot:sb/3476299/